MFSAVTLEKPKRNKNVVTIFCRAEDCRQKCAFFKNIPYPTEGKTNSSITQYAYASKKIVMQNNNMNTPVLRRVLGAHDVRGYAIQFFFFSNP